MSPAMNCSGVEVVVWWKWRVIMMFPLFEPLLGCTVNDDSHFGRPA
jgi:hypothetical protein